MILRTLNYGSYGIFLIMGHAGFCPSAVLAGLPRMKKPRIPGFPKWVEYINRWVTCPVEVLPERLVQARSACWQAAAKGDNLCTCLGHLGAFSKAPHVSSPCMDAPRSGPTVDGQNPALP